MDSGIFRMEKSVSDLQQAKAIVVMGVCGCGKSTVGIELAKRLGMPFIDADDLHPAANIAKMSQSVPLNDDDRWPWLDIVGQKLASKASESGGAVAACSALRQAYRDRITEAAGQPVLFVHLAGSYELISERLNARGGHFMPPALLKSQFETLETPNENELAVEVSIEQGIEQIVDQVVQLRG